MTLDLYNSPYTKTKFKWVKDLNIRKKTLKLLEDKAESTPEAIDLGQDLNRTPIRK